MLASDEFYREEHEEGAFIEQSMTRDFKTIPPELGTTAVVPSSGGIVLKSRVMDCSMKAPSSCSSR